MPLILEWGVRLVRLNKNHKLLTSCLRSAISGEQVPACLPPSHRRQGLARERAVPQHHDNFRLSNIRNHNSISASKYVDMGHHHNSRDKIFIPSSALLLPFFLGGSYAFILSYLHVSWGFLRVGLAVFLQNGVLLVGYFFL